LLTYTTNRQQNLALLQTYGANGWRIQNYLLEASKKHYDEALEQLKELTVEVNRDRKNTQVWRVGCGYPYIHFLTTHIQMTGSHRKATHLAGKPLD